MRGFWLCVCCCDSYYPPGPDRSIIRLYIQNGHSSKRMLDYYRTGNMARDEPQLVRACGRKNFDPVIKQPDIPASLEERSQETARPRDHNANRAAQNSKQS